MFKKRLFTALLAVLMVASAMQAANPKREFRSAWLATVANIDWPKQKGISETVIAQQKSSLNAILDRMVELNMTTVCFQVRSMSDALYESSYEPWADQMTGVRGQHPGWDPLKYAVEECHKRGLEIYAWVNPFRWASSGDLNRWTTPFDEEIKSKGWLLSNGSYIVMNPALPAVRAHIVNVCKEIITKYSVEGMIFDDYFYPSGGMAENSTAADYNLWKNSGTSMTIGDWRRQNVNDAIKEIYDMIQDVRPEVRFGLAPPGTAGASASKYGLTMCPAGYDGQYKSLYADPLYWMANHIVDYMSPQVYWHNDHRLAKFGPLAKWWYELAAHFKNVHCSMSVNIYDLVTSMGSQADLGNTEAHYKEHVTNIKQSREYAAALGLKAFGSNFYSIQYLCSPYKAHGDYLAQNCFQTKALVPVVDWKKAKSYNAVTGLVYTDGKLSWDPVTDGMSTIRYSVYAIPTTVSQKAAMNSDGDGFDAKYLQGVSYLPTFSISSNLQSGYWYAVCVYDGYGNEHAAATTDFDYNGPEPGADGEIYDKNGTVSVECVWFKTVNNGGITFNENGGLNRAFCAVGDYVYISGRESNSSTAAAYLRKINGATGAVVGDIKLGAEASVGLYPCNDVIKDQSGNVCITNLTLDAKTTPLKVHKVNLSNGALTEVASLTVTSTIPNVEKARIDHAALWGDVAKGDFTVYAAISSSASVVRWNFEAGTLVSEQVCTVAQFYPSTVTNFGTAPRVVPVSSTAFYIDGGNTAWSRYLFSNGRMSDSFTENEAIAPTTYFGNGGTFFSLNNNYYITYNSADYEGSYKFNIASSTSKNMGFDTMKLMWTLPKSGMGTVNSGTAQASADYVQVSDDTVRVYYYVPGVGVCAYEIVDSAVSGIDDTVAADVKIVAAGNTIKVSKVAQSINVYNMMGMQVAYAANVQEVDVNVPSGIYIVVVTIDGVAYKQKIVLK